MKRAKPFKMLLIGALALISGSVFAQVKIGTNPAAIDPASNLEVEASTTGRKVAVDKTTGKVTVADGSQADGYVLTSDANGTATWKSPFQESANITTGTLADPHDYALPSTGVTYPASYTINAPITLNKGVYLLYFYFQFTYDTPYSAEPFNANLNTWPIFCYTGFTVISGAGSAAVNHSGLIHPVSPQIVGGLHSQLFTITQDNTVLKPIISGISRKGTVNNSGQIFAVRL